jgi:hypothetical protein
VKTVRALRRNFDDVIRHAGIGASDLIEDRVERDFGNREDNKQESALSFDRSARTPEPSENDEKRGRGKD